MPLNSNTEEKGKLVQVPGAWLLWKATSRCPTARSASFFSRTAAGRAATARETAPSPALCATKDSEPS